MKIRPRFVLIVALAMGLFYWQRTVPEDGYKSRCVVKVSWDDQLNNVVPAAMKDLSKYSGIQWVQVEDNANINFSYGDLSSSILGEAVLAHYGPYIRHVDVTFRQDLTVSYSTVLHEAAHALGIRHTEDPNSYMHAYNLPAQTMTVEDIDNLRAAGNRCY